MKIYIADDDIILVKGLRAIIERNCPGFEVVGEGHNGLQALEDIEHLKPDLLITDIKMPVMDGVELVKRIKNLEDNIKIIVISGYDEYSYIRETLKHGAVDYLLKPVENDDLISLLNKVKGDIKKENENRREINLFYEKVNESLEALKEKVLLYLIKNKSFNTIELGIKLKELGLTKYGMYAIAFIGINGYHPNNTGCLVNFDASVIRLILKRSMENRSNKIEVLETYMETGAVILFVADESSESSFYSNIDATLNEIRSSLEKDYGFFITIGVSKSFNTLDGAYNGYQQSELAFERKLYEGKNKVIYFNSENCCYNYFDIKNLNGLLKELTNYIEICDKRSSKRIITEMFDKMSGEKIQPDQFREIWLRILIRISDASMEFNEAAEQYNFNRVDLLFSLKKVDTLEELIEYILKAISDIIERINDLRTKRGMKIIQRLKEHIKKHYNEDISLTALANHVNFNASYLSQLFKEETGQNFTDYLSEIRINEAKRLLATPEVKVYEVGSMVGYKEPVSFSRAFKRAVGISPQEYKKIAK